MLGIQNKTIGGIAFAGACSLLAALDYQKTAATAIGGLALITLGKMQRECAARRLAEKEIVKFVHSSDTAILGALSEENQMIALVLASASDMKIAGLGVMKDYVDDLKAALERNGHSDLLAGILSRAIKLLQNKRSRAATKVRNYLEQELEMARNLSGSFWKQMLAIATLGIFSVPTAIKKL